MWWTRKISYTTFLILNTLPWFNKGIVALSYNYLLTSVSLYKKDLLVLGQDY